MKVSNIVNNNGNIVANQFIIHLILIPYIYTGLYPVYNSLTILYNLLQ